MAINNLGDRIAQLRKKTSLTQKEFAKILNVSGQLISKWENNQAVPTIDYLEKISNFFGITLDELVYGANKEDVDKENQEEQKVEDIQQPKQMENVVASKPKMSSKKLAKILLASILPPCFAILITGLILLSIFVFVPASNKKNYVEKVNSCIAKYFENNYFDIQFSEKDNNSYKKTVTLKGFIDENGISFSYDGKDEQVLIVNNIDYFSEGYQTVFETNATNVIELLHQFFPKEKGFEYEKIHYIRSTNYGFYFEMDSKFLDAEDGVDSLRYPSNITGNIYIKNGKITRLTSFVTGINTNTKKLFTQTGDIIFSNEKPTIGPYYYDGSYIPLEKSAEDFVKELYNDKEVAAISSLSLNDIGDLKSAFSNGLYCSYNGKLFIAPKPYSTISYVKIFNLEDMVLEKQIKFSKTLSDFEKSILYKNKFFLIGDCKICCVNLDTKSVEEIALKSNEYSTFLGNFENYFSIPQE